MNRARYNLLLPLLFSIIVNGASADCNGMTSPLTLTETSGSLMLPVTTTITYIPAHDICQWTLSPPEYQDILLRVDLIALETLIFNKTCESGGHLVMPDGIAVCGSLKNRCYQYTKAQIPGACTDDIGATNCDVSTLTNAQWSALTFTFNQDEYGLSVGFSLSYEFIDCATTQLTTISKTTPTITITPVAPKSTTVKFETKLETTTTTTSQEKKYPVFTTREYNAETNRPNKITSPEHVNSPPTTSNDTKLTGTQGILGFKLGQTKIILIAAGVGAALLFAIVICIFVMMKKRKTPTSPRVDPEVRLSVAGLSESGSLEDIKKEETVTNEPRPVTVSPFSAGSGDDNSRYDILHAEPTFPLPDYDTLNVKDKKDIGKIHGVDNQSFERVSSGSQGMTLGEYAGVDEASRSIRLPSREKGSIRFLDIDTLKEYEYADMRGDQATDEREEDDFTSEEESETDEGEKEQPPLYTTINR